MSDLVTQVINWEPFNTLLILAASGLGNWLKNKLEQKSRLETLATDHKIEELNFSHRANMNRKYLVEQMSLRIDQRKFEEIELSLLAHIDHFFDDLIFTDEEVFKLFTTLLISSVQTDTKPFVNRIFVDIITQLSPLDVKVFEFLFDNIYTNLYGASYGSETSGPIYIHHALAQYPGYDSNVGYSDVNLSIDNLLRLNLVEISTFESDGNSIEASNPTEDEMNLFHEYQYEQIQELTKDGVGGGGTSGPGVQIRRTNLGERFYFTCVAPHLKSSGTNQDT